jgi:hypothetical protein
METLPAVQVNEKRKAEAILRRAAREKAQRTESVELKQEKTVTFQGSPIDSDDEVVAEGVAAAPAAGEPQKRYRIQKKPSIAPEVVATTQSEPPKSEPPKSASNDDSADSSVILGHKSSSPTSVADGQTPAGSQLTSPSAQPNVGCVEPQFLFAGFASELYTMSFKSMEALAKLLLFTDIPSKKADLHFKLANTTGTAQDLVFVPATHAVYGHFTFSDFVKQNFALPPQQNFALPPQ